MRAHGRVIAIARAKAHFKTLYKAMDTRTESKMDWSWVKLFMPGVTRLMGEKRAEFGPEWIGQCWRAGVIEQKPGWFFAAEGALTIGMPWDDEVIDMYVKTRWTNSQAIVVLRMPQNGQN